MYERLPSLGIDVSVVYPSFGVGFAHVPQDDLRRAACRAVNRYHADVFADYRSRLVPVAVIPMHTPQEAVDELHVAVRDLGFRAVVLAGWVRRPIDAAVAANPELAPLAAWYDFFGLDSPHDYDAVWEACEQLGVMPSFHSGAMGWHAHQSISNYSFNHIGHFAAGNHAVCRSLFLGGVTRRFPDLRFGFLEGGVSWAVTLLADLAGHWEKRNPAAVRRYDPARIDRAAYQELFDRYAGRLRAALPENLADTFGMTRDLPEAHLDEYDGIRSVDELLDRFVPRFFFGCEADDPMTPVAFDRRRVPGGRPLAAMFSSDLGHWDVPDMTQVLPEAYEAVEDGSLDAGAFEAFTFTNATRFYAHGNRAFFAGTEVEADCARLLGVPA
jgi:predicted TIM-barrel fold metal-dependent hydrolase